MFEESVPAKVYGEQPTRASIIVAIASYLGYPYQVYIMANLSVLIPNFQLSLSRGLHPKNFRSWLFGSYRCWLRQWQLGLGR